MKGQFVKLQNLTLAEMERLAYIEGRTAEAALLAALMDDEGYRGSKLRREIARLQARLAECDCDEGKAKP